MLGVYTIVLELLVWCSDPGFITSQDNTTSDEAFLEYNSFSSDENEKDEIYKVCHLYTNRDCKTCDISRPPKASHCGLCGHCVRGFDHHCHIFNTCVGRRNLRVFVLFLVVCWVWLAMCLVASTVNTFLINESRVW